ncbi:prepilin peptidase [Candidatus Woesearchaeota archaeon]|nr:prepilin peptidase [Candidatus Woesearchaeota archaeon]
MLFSLVMGTITFLFLAAASYSDLRTREVPDMLSYGLIIVALGIRGIFVPELGWGLLLSGALGFAACFLLAWLFYKTNLWGGGDSKLLMGMGAVIGINYPLDLSSLLLLWFFVLLLFLGSIYGLCWLFGLSVIRWKVCKPKFIEKVHQFEKVQWGLGLGSLVVVGLSLLDVLWLFFLLPVFVFYLFLFVTTIEEECFVKRVSPAKLTEGDWLGEEIFVDEERFPRRRALEMKDIEKLLAAHKEGKLPSVVIREGVPFVPSFVLAYAVLLWGMPLAVMVGKMFLGRG